MVIYNVTTNIAEEVETQWLHWMRTKHIPAVLATGNFMSARLVRVLVEEEMGGATYAAQYAANNKEDLQKYYNYDAPKLREEAMVLFGDKMLAFRTELEVLEDFIV
jgi:hypothetical protein